MHSATKKSSKIIAQSGFSDLLLLFFKFFDGKKAKGMKNNGRNGKFV